MHDIVIRGASLVDGTGSPARRADVAIDGELITEVGDVTEQGRRTIDARDATVAPGWIDIHTHLDAQLFWDDAMVQSAAQGVTSAVMGNCGVGIAPVRPADRPWIFDLLDGVEDIPASALTAAVDVTWTSFAEYLNAVATRSLAFDVGVHLPHSALRRFVMGERGGDSSEKATADDIAAMAAEVRVALAAGAVGVSTSRTANHKSRSTGQPIGTLTAAPQEVLGLASACQEAGMGVFQLVSDLYQSTDTALVRDELSLVEQLGTVGRPVSMSLLQSASAPRRYRGILDHLARLHEAGGRTWAQVAPRPIGVIYALTAPSHPLMRSRSYRGAVGEGSAGLVARMAEPAFRAVVVDEVNDSLTRGRLPALDFGRLYPLGDVPDYAPDRSASVAAVAAASSSDPVATLYDISAAAPVSDGAMFSPFMNYADGDMTAVREMVTSPRALFGLSDSGAHNNSICDASFPTYALSYWGRDTTLDRVPVEHLVHCQTARAAGYLGWDDRGVVKAGYLADLNVIDLATVGLRRPTLVSDLPQGGSRYVQPADGYLATIKRGQVVAENGTLTQSRPGRLVRGQQPAPARR